MSPENNNEIETMVISLSSNWLKREVVLEVFLPAPLKDYPKTDLLLLNDGQDLNEMHWKDIHQDFLSRKAGRSLVAVGIHAGINRKMEYGISGIPDYQGLGAFAGEYANFILEELLPFLQPLLPGIEWDRIGIAGWSLGGLSALDIGWANPKVFSRVGVFSGSLWWRSLDQQDPAYRDDRHRIMHQVISKGHYTPGMKFFFSAGTLDETSDRNNNGIIDAIDDTLDLVAELEKKGFTSGYDIQYLEMEGGRHHPVTWAMALPFFLDWAFE